MRDALFKSNVGLGLYKEAEECAFRGPQGAYNDHTDTYNRLLWLRHMQRTHVVTHTICMTVTCACTCAS